MGRDERGERGGIQRESGVRRCGAGTTAMAAVNQEQARNGREPAMCLRRNNMLIQSRGASPAASCADASMPVSARCAAAHQQHQADCAVLRTMRWM